MNLDSSASIGSTNITAPNPVANIKHASLSSTSPTTSTIQAKTLNPPTISVSAPDGSEELRFTSPFNAAHTAYRKSEPHPKKDLLKQYGLNWLEKKVARVHPKTGEKINRLRKSYENQVKNFKMSGKPKAFPHNAKTDGRSLLQLANFPAEDYRAQSVNGKEIGLGLSEANQNGLEKALNLQPGKVPRHAEWLRLLAFDKEGNNDTKAKKQEVRKEEPQQAVNIPKINGYTNGVTSNPESNRPKRAGKKRSYIDASFEGYGEGFDEGRDEASSDAESKQSSNGRNKRRKSNNLSPSTQSGYGIGMPPQNTFSRGISSYASRG